MAQVIAVIVTHNNADTIDACVTSLSAQHPVQNTIIVDCASLDTTVEIVKKKFPKVQIFQIENRGYTGGNNFGIEKALKQNPEYVLMLNPDTVAVPGMLQKLIGAAQKEKGIFGPLIFKDSSKKIIWSAGGMLDPVRYSSKLSGYNVPTPRKIMMYPVEGHFISGTCLLIPRTLLEQGHRFEEKYFMYYEDVEFCVRAKKLGYPSLCVPSAHLIHSETSNTMTNKSRKYYYLARNHLLFVGRNAPIGVQLHEIARLPKTIFEYYSQPNPAALRGIRDYLLRKFGPYDHQTEKRRSQTQTDTQDSH